MVGEVLMTGHIGPGDSKLDDAGEMELALGG